MHNVVTVRACKLAGVRHFHFAVGAVAGQESKKTSSSLVKSF
jgi:hypothetical protein